LRGEGQADGQGAVGMGRSGCAACIPIDRRRRVA
jgi:hypothetical protein